MRTLVLTVGCSPAPIATCVTALRPDRVVFLCSSASRHLVDGDGQPCEHDAEHDAAPGSPCLLRQLNPRDYEIVELADPDDATECYLRTTRVLDTLRTQPGAEILADYTGGTKTMSACLVAAALDRRIPLYLTSRDRTHLRSVGADSCSERVETVAIHANRALTAWVPGLLETYDYQGALRLLQRLQAEDHLRDETRGRVGLLQNVCGALEAWDRFDHALARKLLGHRWQHPLVQGLCNRLDRLMAARAEIDGQPAESSPSHHGYELVWDLVLNARRRAAQGRYDDAVGRLYRALELLAQVRLLTAYGIKTASVDPQVIPAEVRSEIIGGRSADPLHGGIPVGLFASYRLLSGFTDDPVGARFLPQAWSLRQALEARNFSLFAHGFRPLDEEAYSRFSAVAGQFLNECLRDLTDADLPPQLPGALPDLTSISPQPTRTGNLRGEQVILQP